MALSEKSKKCIRGVRNRGATPRRGRKAQRRCRTGLIGTSGTMVLPHWSRPLLYPDKKFKDFKYPEIASHDHWGEFVQACQGKTHTQAGFDYAGPLTEVVLLGGVASRFPQTTLNWNAKALKFDLAEANQFIRRSYRKGWSIKGLS